MKNTKMPPLRGWVKLPRMLQPLLEGRNCRLHALVNHLLWEAPVEGGEFGISVRQLSRSMVVAQKTVRELLLELKEIGFLTKCLPSADGVTVDICTECKRWYAGAHDGVQGCKRTCAEVQTQVCTHSSLYNIVENREEEKEKDLFSSPFPSSEERMEEMKRLFRERDGV